MRHRLRLLLFLLLSLLLLAVLERAGWINLYTPTPVQATPALRVPSCLEEARWSYCWALIGNESDGEHLEVERAAGIRAKVFSLSWRLYMPEEDRRDERYVERKLAEYHELQEAGFDVFLSLGFQDSPEWVHDAYPNSHYINQYGVLYHDRERMDQGDLNLIFNDELRALVEAYTEDVFATFGDDFAAVRLGGGRYGELTYPPAVFEDKGNSYWAFDGNAQERSPVPGWKPGDSSPRGEAARFLEWYLDSLVDFQNWQIEMVREHYSGPLMMLYPSWGIRPGNLAQAVLTNLNGSSPAERNGEIPRGYDFARQIAAIKDSQVIVTTTWLDADASADDKADPRYWSPVKYLTSLAAAHPLQLALFGENTGDGHWEDMEVSAAQMSRYGLLGMAWFREEQLFSGEYATLDDYERLIATTGFRLGRPHLFFLPLFSREP